MKIIRFCMQPTNIRGQRPGWNIIATNAKFNYSCIRGYFIQLCLLKFEY